MRVVRLKGVREGKWEKEVRLWKKGKEIEMKEEDERPDGEEGRSSTQIERDWEEEREGLRGRNLFLPPPHLLHIFLTPNVWKGLVLSFPFPPHHP